jgi:hypothetical protein
VILRLSGRRERCLVAAVAALWIAGCGFPGSPSGRVLTAGNNDNGKLISAASGDEIDVTLQTIGPGAYNERPDVSSPAVVFSKVSMAGPQNPGGPRQLFQFKAMAAGHAVISIPHTAQNLRFEISVDVR